MLVLALGACRPKVAESTPTLDSKVVLTAAAETAMVRLTQAAGQFTPTPSTAPGSPTPDLALTAAFSTVEAQFTQQARLTPSPQPSQTPAASATAGGANLAERALYVADVTIPDGTDFSPGTSFTKTWRLKNSGTSTWTTAYTLAFISGEKMGGPDRVNLTSTVQPGATIDISVNLVAPSTTGNFRGYWKLVNAEGKFIEDAVYVEIDVIQSSGATAVSVTPTSQSGSVTLTNVSMAVDANTYTGACPHSFTFTGRFTLNQPATVTYRLEAGSDTPGFTFTLPPAQTGSFPAGAQALTFTFEFTQTVSGWISLHLTSPQDITSNQASFSLTCQP